ncbi:MAG: hypothetical protein LQ340_004714, partial [Diploschistes diacapsis]
MQQIFQICPDRDRFETSDLWTEHPQRKGLWKIVGREDDHVCLSHGNGLHALRWEPEIERSKDVRAALVGGHGRPVPVLLVEWLERPQGDMESEAGRRELLRVLQPYIDKANSICYPRVQLLPEYLIFVSKDNRFVRTVKGSVARAQSLKLYGDENSCFAWQTAST